MSGDGDGRNSAASWSSVQVEALSNRPSHLTWFAGCNGQVLSEISTSLRSADETDAVVVHAILAAFSASYDRMCRPLSRFRCEGLTVLI